MAISEKLYTITDYEAFAEAHPDAVLELINGQIVNKLGTELRGYLMVNIASCIVEWKKRHDAKGHPTITTSHRLNNDKYNERRPDVSFRYTDDDVSQKSAVYTMPDFAVEVKSLGNTYVGLREKAEFYIGHGTRLVWLVYPARQIVEVYFADGSSELFTMEHTLSGGDVLPEFEMAVKEIFEG
ncbi:MAG: Uma2 family endonuclease [Chloroflexota bacterium]